MICAVIKGIVIIVYQLVDCVVITETVTTSPETRDNVQFVLILIEYITLIIYPNGTEKLLQMCVLSVVMWFYWYLINILFEMI